MTFTDKPDYWSLLGLSPNSTSGELKRAFRREARKWHPDLNGNDIQAEERFKLVNEAYAVLSDPRKRQLWEEFNKINQEPFAEGFPDFNDYLDEVLGIDDPNTNSFNENTFNQDFAEEQETKARNKGQTLRR